MVREDLSYIIDILFVLTRFLETAENRYTKKKKNSNIDS